jgi:hypothetical protein
MSITEIRDTLVALVYPSFSTAFPGVTLLFDNAPFDDDNPPERYVEFEVVFYDGHQANISVNPVTRYQGCVYVTAWTKRGIGSREGQGYLDWMASNLKYRTSNGVLLQEPKPTHGPSTNAWFQQGLKVPFHVDVR